MGYIVLIFILIGIMLAIFSWFQAFRRATTFEKNGIADLDSIKEIEEVSSIHIKKFHTVQTLSSSDIIWTDHSEVPQWQEHEEVSELTSFPEKNKRYLIWLVKEKNVDEKEPFWAWFQTPQSIKDGLIHTVDDWGQLGFVSCRIIQELEGSMHGAWYEIEVEKTIPLSQVSSTLPADPFSCTVQYELLEHIHCEYLWSDSQWEILSSEPTRHSGQWVIIEKLEQEKRILAYNHWINETHEIYLMNLPLKGSDADYLALQATARHTV